VYFAVMLPEQVVANSEVLRYFDSVHFLCLTCRPADLRRRLAARVQPGAVPEVVQRWVDFNEALVAAARQIPTATVVDAGRTVDQLEDVVRLWIDRQLGGRGDLRTTSTV
jgi:hypothetical protein